jgi:hypothetical protein
LAREADEYRDCLLAAVEKAQYVDPETGLLFVPNLVIREPGEQGGLPFPDTAVVWDKFVPTEFAGVAVAARDANGLMGPLSTEYLITR